MEETEEEKGHIIPYRTFLNILAILIALTLTSVALTQIYLGALTVAAALVIAAVKSSLVLSIFMHLRYEKRILILMVSFVSLLICCVIIVTMLDYLYR